MKTSKKAEMAVNYKHTANNCAQAVLLAFQDEIGKSAEELKALVPGSVPAWAAWKLPAALCWRRHCYGPAEPYGQAHQIHHEGRSR